MDLDNYAIEPFLWGKGFAHWMVLQFNNERKKNRLYRDTFVLNPVTRSCNVTQGLFGGLVRVLLL